MPAWHKAVSRANCSASWCAAGSAMIFDCRVWQNRAVEVFAYCGCVERFFSILLYISRPCASSLMSSRTGRTYWEIESSTLIAQYHYVDLRGLLRYSHGAQGGVDWVRACIVTHPVQDDLEHVPVGDLGAYCFGDAIYHVDHDICSPRVGCRGGRLCGSRAIGAGLSGVGPARAATPPF